MATEQHTTSKQQAILSLVGSGIAAALLGVALQLGQYKEKIDALSVQLAENGAVGKENNRHLTELAQTNALQERFDEEVDKRLAKLEAK